MMRGSRTPGMFLGNVYRVARAKAGRVAVRASLPLVRRALGSRSQSGSGLANPPVFIIGLPRCGSTFLYQAITNYFDVAYIDNLACRWSDDLSVGMELSRRLYGNRPHCTFDSQLGTTRGGHAPSECGPFWYRWLPSADHFVPGEVSACIANDIRKEVTFISAVHDKTFVFKNLHMGQRIRLLRQALPEARFVRLIRDHTEVVASILKARRSRNSPADKIWSTKPARWRELTKLPELDMVASQVVALERQIDHDLELYPSSQTLSLHFPGSFVDDSLVKPLEDFIGALRRPGGEFELPRRTGDLVMPEAQFTGITAALERAATSPFTIPVPYGQGALTP